MIREQTVLDFWWDTHHYTIPDVDHRDIKLVIDNDKAIVIEDSAVFGETKLDEFPVFLAQYWTTLTDLKRMDERLLQSGLVTVDLALVGLNKSGNRNFCVMGQGGRMYAFGITREAAIRNFLGWD